MWVGAGLWVVENLSQWLATYLALTVNYRVLTLGWGFGLGTPIFQVSFTTDLVERL